MNYLLQKEGIEDVGPTAQEILKYARMFNLLTRNIYVNLTAIVFKFTRNGLFPDTMGII